MALKYHLVQRLDKSKDAAAGSKLYYGQIRAQQKLEFNKLCEIIASYSTASRGDVMLVIDGLLYVMRQHLENGEVVQVGDFGNFRMLAGSKGTAVADDFTTSLFKKGRIVFTPGPMLKEVTAKPKFEKIVPISRTDSKQKRYQHRCSEHSKHMLKTQRDQHLYRYFLVHLNDFFLHFFFLLLFL